MRPCCCECASAARAPFPGCSGLLILDEADLLMQMGFAPTLTSIVEALGAAAAPGVTRQSALLSATLSQSVHTLASLSLHEPAIVSIGDGGETGGDSGGDGGGGGGGDGGDGGASGGGGCGGAGGVGHVRGAGSCGSFSEVNVQGDVAFTLERMVAPSELVQRYT
eukprot:5680657-Pleurochrysis_carterae.AAC.1